MTIKIKVLKAKATDVNGYINHLKHGDIEAQGSSHFRLDDGGHDVSFEVYGSGFKYAAGFPTGGSVRHFVVEDHGAARIDVSFSPAVKVSTLTNSSAFARYFQNQPYEFTGHNGNDTFTSVYGNDRLEGRDGNDRLDGYNGNDYIDGGKGDDILDGREDKDVLVGGLGRDKLYGGKGPDTFDFNSIRESVTGSKRDIIETFHRSQDDRLDLRDIDADATASGNQAFKFIGGDAFGNVAGELRFSGGILRGDVNGDGSSDFEVKVVGIASMVKSDFLL
jgi:Ca2+-binding RTX toxin-like protein